MSEGIEIDARKGGRMERRFNIAVERSGTCQSGRNKTWTVVLDGKLIGMVELCGETREHRAIYYAPDGTGVVDTNVRFPGTREGMASAVGYVVAMDDARRMQPSCV